MTKPTLILTEWVSESRSDGTYSLDLGHDYYCDLFSACEELECTTQAQAEELRAKDATIAALRAALESLVRVADDCADSENVNFMDKAIESARQALAASAPRTVKGSND